MTPETFREIRSRAGFTQLQLARFLRLGDGRTVRNYEAGDRAIPGPVAFLMELLDAGKLTKRSPAR